MLKQIAESEKSIKQWDAAIEEKKNVLQQATAKITDLKATLDKVVKEELKLQGS